MRKITPRFRGWLQRRSKSGVIRQSSGNERAQVRRIAKESFHNQRLRLPVLKESFGQDHIYFDPPALFSLAENYEETLSFILAVREYFSRRRRERCSDGIYRGHYANFSMMRSVEPAAGLVLAAEIDRWRQSAKRKPKPHDHLWDVNVREFFRDAGLFTLLNIDPLSVASATTMSSGRRTLPFRSGRLTDGQSAHRLRAELEAICGEQIGPQHIVYGALCEAMTNVAHHAYPSAAAVWPFNGARRWWASGAWTPGTKSVSVQLYDQGVGIPRTLPKSDQWYSVVPLLNRLDPERTDAGMIEAAMEYSRTSTGEPGRGKGLSQMAEWIDLTGTGFLRIMSGRGLVRYEPGKPIRKDALREPFCGTLIEWEVSLNG